MNQQLANCLIPISSWIENHGMALNFAKTKYIVVAPKLERLRGERIYITHNGTAIKTVDSHKPLDLLLDETSTWTLHIDKVCTRVLK